LLQRLTAGHDCILSETYLFILQLISDIKTDCTVKDQNGWRIRTNDELQVMYRKRNIVTAINIRRQWPGHLVRTCDDRTVKEVFLGKPDGRRKAGRPEVRWLDCIENDLKWMGVKRWRRKAEGRPVWAIIQMEALVKL
jgi:hypothetical protein